MAVSKKFLEAVSKDKALNAEVDKATLEALGAFLKEKGLEDEAAKAAEAAMEKIAEAHGFKAEAMEAVSADELEAVAGGGCVCCFGEPEIFSAIAANVAHVVQAIITRTGIVSAPYLELVGAKAIIGSSRSFSGNAA